MVILSKKLCKICASTFLEPYDMKSKFLLFLRRIPELTRYLQIILVLVIISFIFPDYSAFHYSFEKNGVWRYADLIAPFDFAIQKEDSEYKADIDAVKAKLYPFYTKDSTIAARQRIAFSNAFLSQLMDTSIEEDLNHVRANQDLYRQLGLHYIDQSYRKGVFRLEKQHLVAGETGLINLVNRPGEFSRRMIRSLTTEEMAKEAISDSLKKAIQLERPLFLEEILKKTIIPNIIYNDTLTRMFHDEAISRISKSKDKVSEGDVIVRRSEVINSAAYQKLLSLQEIYANQESGKNEWLVFGGYFILTTLLLIVFVLFFAIFHKNIFYDLRQLSFMLMWLILYSYLVYYVNDLGFLNPYMIPFCIAPIIIKNFYNEEIALFSYVIIILIAGFLSAQGYEFLFVELLAGIVVVLAKVRVRDWSSFFQSMIYVLLTYALSHLGLSLIKEGTLANIEWQPLAWIGLNIVLTALAFPLIPLLERIFGYTSEMTLVELGSLDKPLLKELSLKAPGTLQHSLQVGNLAEAAASAIGADALLVKVAAYYHDIGKIKAPYFFVENQSGKSPHDNLTPLESAQIILDHMTEGVRMAKKERLPKILIDFIETHHGTTRVEFFYKKHLAENPDAPVDESLFRYSGRVPSTKEEIILMLADSIEAASKSLKNPDEQSIDELVEGIIEGKIKQRQFEAVDLSFKELETVKAVLKKQLKSIYHVRIAY